MTTQEKLDDLQETLDMFADPSSRAELLIGFADKFKGVSYPDVVSHVIRTMLKEPLRGRTRLVIDASGLGRVVSNLLDDQGVQHSGRDAIHHFHRAAHAGGPSSSMTVQFCVP